jgi:rRNA-processing protein FCF1
MRKVILDTNILMYCAKYRIDLFRELVGFELYTFDNMLNELKKIAGGKGKDAALARISLEFTKKMKVIKTTKPVDKSLVDFAKKDFIIFTQDREVQKKLKEMKKSFGYLRQKRFLVIE